MSAFALLIPPGGVTPSPFAGLQNAPLPRRLLYTRSFGVWLEPRYIFGAGFLLDQ
jgi:hypothetical protein